MSYRVRKRSTKLIHQVLGKLVIGDASSRIGALLVTLIDSIIAARFVGVQAIPAIALVVPVIQCMTIVQDFFLSGTTQVLITYKSQGQNREANRAFAAILTNIVGVYAVMCGILFVVSRPLFGFFTQDATLISDSFAYLLPMLILEPINIGGYCLERGFRTDGRFSFFGMRMVITNILNILFSLCAVLVFKGGIFSISLASCLAGFFGYCWSLTHIFSQKCTTKPDFEVLKHRKEYVGYIKEEVSLGYIYLFEDSLNAVSSIIINKAYLVCGGTVALAAIGICTSVNSLFYSLTQTIDGAAKCLLNMFFVDRDEKGFSLTFHSAVKAQAYVSLLIFAIVNAGAYGIGLFYNLEPGVMMNTFRLCLFLTSMTAIMLCYANLNEYFLLTVNRVKQATYLSVAGNSLLILAGLIGLAGISFSLLLILQLVGTAVVLLAGSRYISFIRPQLFNGKCPDVYACSYTLDEVATVNVSRDVADHLTPVIPRSEMVLKASLLVEECNKLIRYVNRDNPQPIFVDLRVTVAEDRCIITLIDTGKIFDPVSRIERGEVWEEFEMNRRILTKMAHESTYSRIVDVNLSHLVLPLSQEIHEKD
ncbi:MAG: MATE family efflux transporter [Lachnospiraceae bacterium]|nr:MATE family efflux transporter [Lachnospiraceae bacterium]